MMNIDEAIRGEEAIADACREQANMSDLDEPYARKVAYENGKCAEMHKQIAEWLKELKKLKKLACCEDCVSRIDLVNKLEVIDKRYGSDFYWEMRKIVDSLPSVKPVACIGTVKFSKEAMQERVMTNEEAKSCIETIEMLQELAYNIRGVIDVIDVNNCKKIIKVLEQEPCEDAISRAETVQFLANHSNDFEDARFRMAFKTASSLVNNPHYLPTVRPTQRKGKWITKFHGFPAEPTLVCSECGFDRDFNINTRGFGKIKYCPNCGTKMEEK